MTANDKRSETNRKKHEDLLATTPFLDLKPMNRWKVLFQDQDGACNHCGNTHWRGEMIPLEIEHKNGDHHDNSRENVELICPNCHALTDTYRGRNKRENVKRVSDEVLIQALRSTKNIRQALLSVGLAGKGKNYVRAKRLQEQIGA